MLSSVSECKKAVMGVTERICRLDKLHSDISYSPSVKVSLNRNTHKHNYVYNYNYKHNDQNATRGSQEPTPCTSSGSNGLVCADSVCKVSV